MLDLLPAPDMASKEYEHLLEVLQSRDIALGVDDVAWAFADSPTRDKAETWIRKYLQSSTLLTKDELV